LSGEQPRARRSSIERLGCIAKERQDVREAVGIELDEPSARP
jgi:hypothetical protein